MASLEFWKVGFVRLQCIPIRPRHFAFVAKIKESVPGIFRSTAEIAHSSKRRLAQGKKRWLGASKSGIGACGYPSEQDYVSGIGCPLLNHAGEIRIPIAI